MAAQDKSACEVVKAPAQFSWYGFKPILPFTDEMRGLLERVKAHRKILINEKFQWFYGITIPRPKWAFRMDCRRIGRQKYCREKE